MVEPVVFSVRRYCCLLAAADVLVVLGVSRGAGVDVVVGIRVVVEAAGDDRNVVSDQDFGFFIVGSEYVRRRQYVDVVVRCHGS